MSKRKREAQDEEQNIRPMSHAGALSHGSYTIGWICALPLEMAAARVMLDEIHSDLRNPSQDLNSYIFGAVGDHNVVITCLPSGIYGVAPAALAVSQMQSSFPSIQFFMMIGIGGGAPSMADIRLGDVVVSMPVGQHPGVIQYDRGKTMAGGLTQETGSLNRPPRGLLNVVSKLRAIHSTDGSRILKFIDDVAKRSRAGTAFMQPEGEDILFRAEYNHIDLGTDNCNFCDEDEIVARPPRDTQCPAIHYGTIASGNQVIKDGKSRDLIAKKHGAYCFEMEAAGVSDVVECLVVRGICDYSDSHKNKRWQGYAAGTAAAYAKELLLTLSASEKPAGSTPKHTTVVGPGPGQTSRTRINTGSFSEEHGLTQLSGSEEYRIKSLRSLCFQGMDYRLNSIAQAHQNTCNWIFNADMFLRWRDRRNVEEFNGVLWIKGKPGAGKSTLMKQIFLHCQKHLAGYSIGAYFFSARGVGLEKSHFGMLRSLLYQLLDEESDLACDIFFRRFRDKEKKHGISWEWHEGELEAILSELVSSLDRPILLLVDALDECGEGEVRRVVSFLERLGLIAANSSKGSLNICLSSRHYPTITMAKMLDLVIDRREGHTNDMVIYIQDKLRIKQADIQEELQEKASGVFLWVVLVVEMLNRSFGNGDIDEAQRKLREIPADLDEVFRLILEVDNPELNRTIFTLQFMLFVNSDSRIRAIELYYAIKSASEPQSLRKHDNEIVTSEVIEAFIVNCSRGLVEVEKVKGEPRFSYVQFIHQTVADFLLRNRRLQGLCSQLTTEVCIEGFSHQRIASCCLAYMKMKDILIEFKMESTAGPDWSPGGLDRGLGSYWRSASHFERSGIIVERKLECFGPDFTTTRAAFTKYTRSPDYLNERYPFLEYATTMLFYHAELASSGHKRTLQRFQKNPNLFELMKRAYGLPIYNHSTTLDVHFEGEHRTDASLLYALCLRNRPTLVKTLLLLLPNPQKDINTRGGCHMTPLRAAISVGAIEITRVLLDSGADVNISGRYLFNALQTAVYPYHFNENTPTVVSILIKAGANVNDHGGEFYSVLSAAAGVRVRSVINVRLKYKHVIEVIRILLDSGAEVNASGGEYGTPLQAAVLSGRHYSRRMPPLDLNLGSQQKKVIEMLLSAGADVNLGGGLYGSALRALMALEFGMGLVAYADHWFAPRPLGDGWGTGSEKVGTYRMTKDAINVLRSGDPRPRQGPGKHYTDNKYIFLAETLRMLLDVDARITAPGGFYCKALQALGIADILRVPEGFQRSCWVRVQDREGCQLGSDSYFPWDERDTFYAEVVDILLVASAHANANDEHDGNTLRATCCSSGQTIFIELLLDENRVIVKEGGISTKAIGTALTRDCRCVEDKRKVDCFVDIFTLLTAADIPGAEEALNEIEGYIPYLESRWCQLPCCLRPWEVALTTPSDADRPIKIPPCQRTQVPE
ncbi:hypothetical protein TWF718_010144 [Orbilia javanica]|uniref:Nephrocystin 3-like N-terminal domain-containing protein n=1 Tax=Orbilia javanica TaxID=47235 RepID=A0AAN8MHJ4_9PEZI